MTYWVAFADNSRLEVEAPSVEAAKTIAYLRFAHRGVKVEVESVMALNEPYRPLGDFTKKAPNSRGKWGLR